LLVNLTKQLQMPVTSYVLDLASDCLRAGLI
jgi:hypothetical protein